MDKADYKGYTRHHVRGEDYPGIIDDNALYALLGKDAGWVSAGLLMLTRQPAQRGRPQCPRHCHLGPYT